MIILWSATSYSELSFGVLFATAVTLILVPALYLVGDDVTSMAQRLLGSSKGDAGTEPTVASTAL